MKQYIQTRIRSPKSVGEIAKLVRQKKSLPIIVDTFEKKSWYRKIRDKITGRRIVILSVLSVILGILVRQHMSLKKKLHDARNPKKTYNHDPSQNSPSPNGKPKNYKGLKHIYSDTTMNNIKKHLNQGKINR